MKYVHAVLVVSVLGAVPGRAAPLEAKKTQGLAICGVGVPSPSGKVLYLPGTSGGVEAVALWSGKRLWESDRASVPLLATEDRLFARVALKKRNQLKVVVLDAITGEQLLTSEPVTFPDWVSVPRDFGLRFQAGARLDKGDLLLLWEARRFRDGGPPPPDPDPYKKHATGAVRIDLATGRVSETDYKPRENEVPEDEPSWVGKSVYNGWTFQVEEKYPDPGFPHSKVRRWLKAEAADGKREWRHEIGGAVYLPPRP